MKPHWQQDLGEQIETPVILKKEMILLKPSYIQSSFKQSKLD